MSYDNVSGGQLSRTKAPFPRISMGWYRQFNYSGTGHSLSRHTASGGSDSGIDTDTSTGTTLLASSQGGGSSVTLATGSDTSWIFICIVLVQGSGLDVYWRHEGDTSLNHSFITDTGVNDTSDNMELLLGTSGGGGGTHCRLSAYKEWLTEASLTSTQILAESTQNAPIVTTNLTNYLSCDSGHTVGVDQSATSSDWTVTGTFTINADEPNTSIGPGSVATTSWIVSS